MQARKGEWFSLRWDITDFYDRESYLQFDIAPKFLYALEDTPQIEGEVIQTFDRLHLVSIFKTTVFITGGEESSPHSKIKKPTHYREEEGFMPGVKPRYDGWLLEYHKVHLSLSEQISTKESLLQKKVFLEHTAKVIRHDMHSGINTYLPRAVRALRKRLPLEVIQKYKLESTMKLLEEGLDYTRRVYQGVYAFTNLVKEDPILEKEDFDAREELERFMLKKAYYKKVEISELRTISAQPILFCIAIENLVKGGLQYNNSKSPQVKIYLDPKNPYILCIEDNGVGLSREDFYKFCKPFYKDIHATGLQGLELNIAVAILQDHGFFIEPEKLENREGGTGTLFRIDLDTTKERDLILH